jgi:hypothetical protein
MFPWTALTPTNTAERLSSLAERHLRLWSCGMWHRVIWYIYIYIYIYIYTRKFRRTYCLRPRVTVLPWRWKRQACPLRWYPSTKQYEVTTKSSPTLAFIFTAMRASHLVWCRLLPQIQNENEKFVISFLFWLIFVAVFLSSSKKILSYYVD